MEVEWLPAAGCVVVCSRRTARFPLQGIQGSLTILLCEVWNQQQVFRKRLRTNKVPFECLRQKNDSFFGGFSQLLAVFRDSSLVKLRLGSEERDALGRGEVLVAGDGSPHACEKAPHQWKICRAGMCWKRGSFVWAHLVPGPMRRLGSRPFVLGRAAGQTTISLLFGAHSAWEPCCYFYSGGAVHSSPLFGGGARSLLGSD